MTASVQWLAPAVALLRTHPTGGLGDPYTWSVVVTVEEGVVTPHGVHRAPNLAEARAVREAVKGMGLCWRVDRRRPGRSPVNRDLSHARSEP